LDSDQCRPRESPVRGRGFRSFGEARLRGNHGLERPGAGFSDPRSHQAGASARAPEGSSGAPLSPFSGTRVVAPRREYHFPWTPPVHRRVWYSVILASAAAFASGAAPPSWSPLGPPGGGIDSVVVDPLDPQTLYIGAEQGGIWKSTDGGAHWSAASG